MMNSATSDQTEMGLQSVSTAQPGAAFKGSSRPNTMQPRVDCGVYSARFIVSCYLPVTRKQIVFQKKKMSFILFQTRRGFRKHHADT